MPDSTTKIRRSGRPAFIVVGATILYFLTFGAILYEFDRQYYVQAKLQIIRNNFEEIFALPENLNDEAWAVPSSSGSAVRRLAEEHFRETARAIVDGPTSIYRVTLFDADKQPVIDVANNQKPARLNTWRNNLFLRGFDGISVRGQGRPVNASETQLGWRIMLHYTSPRDYPPITELTRQYRLYVAGIILFGLLCYYFLLRYLVLPLRNVVAYVERSKTGSPRLISRPYGLLESSYNDIARQALLQQLQDKLTEAQRTDASRRDVAMETALDFARNMFGMESIQLAELSRTGDDLTLISSYSSPRDRGLTGEEICTMATQFAHRPDLTQNGGTFESAPDSSFCFLSAAGNTAVFVRGQLPSATPDAAFRVECARQVCEALRHGLLAMHAYQQDMLRQRSEANIVLSRNLGHDLTNVIATTKLDLLALKALLNAPEHNIGGPKRDLVNQSVSGLLENTRLLQEIVNIYRSFSYVKRPQFERQNLNELVGQFLDTFEPSMSSRVVIRREFAENIPSPIVEPRLLKLALFNLLSNAHEALKRVGGGNGAEPCVVARISYDAATEEFRIEVEDNGPGIRDASGRLLARGEIGTIFQYGYSTKPEASEGLGLNWVRTIIEDFHAGRAEAENKPGGGARFILTVKSMESAEARIRPESAG